MQVKALTEFSYDLIDRKAGDVIDMPEAHAFALQTLGKVMKAESGDEVKEERATSKGNRYKTRHLRAEG